MLFRFDPLFKELDRFASAGAVDRTIPVDAVNRGDHVELAFDLPGFTPETVELTVEKGVLRLQAERPAPESDTDQKVITRERWSGTRSRWLRLGEHLDPEGLEATFVDGVLRVRIPVRATETARRIEIGSGPAVEPAA